MTNVSPLHLPCSYAFFRGKDNGGGKKGSVKEVGKLKGMLRVITNKNEPLPMDLNPTVLFKPKPLHVRVYVLRGYNMQPMDSNGLADPYLKVRLGKQKANSRSRDKPKTLNPEFYECFEFNTYLPGESQLQIEVWDHDKISKDEHIGTTVIDLEDRWFDKRWQDMGHDALDQDKRLLAIQQASAGPDPESGDAINSKQLDFGPRVAPKPLEMRPLWKPSSSNQQGVLQCWVDILNKDDTDRFPPVDIKPPPPEKFEMRLIVWKTRDVVAMDTVTNQNDLFVRCWMEEDDKNKQQTDCHYRCKHGKGSFNWRMKFNMELPQKFPYLHIQMWDRDIFSYNDCIAEAVLDMSAAFKRAFKLKKGFTMFQDGPKDDNADAGDAPSRSKRGQLGEEETKVWLDLCDGFGRGCASRDVWCCVWCVLEQGSQPGGGDADNDGTYQPPTPAFPSDVLDDGEDASRPLLGNSINSTMSVRDRRGRLLPLPLPLALAQP